MRVAIPAIGIANAKVLCSPAMYAPYISDRSWAEKLLCISVAPMAITAAGFKLEACCDRLFNS